MSALWPAALAADRLLGLLAHRCSQICDKIKINQRCQKIKIKIFTDFFHFFSLFFTFLQIFCWENKNFKNLSHRCYLWSIDFHSLFPIIPLSRSPCAASPRWPLYENFSFWDLTTAKTFIRLAHETEAGRRRAHKLSLDRHWECPHPRPAESGFDSGVLFCSVLLSLDNA